MPAADKAKRRKDIQMNVRDVEMPELVFLPSAFFLNLYINI